jgi:ABC-2 type transport system ATP-binding protein
MKDAGDVVVTEHLTKSYDASRGIVDVSMTIAAGEVFGFLGPNGAGKTTTIRTLLDFIRPTSGRASVLGMDPRTASVEVHRRVGYLPGEFAAYEHMTGREYLAYFAGLRGGVDQRVVDTLAERLQSDLSVRIASLSHGNTQKLGLIQAFMHQPTLLILDEPTQGLDPIVQQRFHALVLEARAAGQTVFLSSHDLPEVERVCDRVGIIRDGRLITVEDVGSLKARAVRMLEIRFASPVPADAFSGLPGVRDVEVHGDVVRCTVAGAMDPLVKAAARFEVVDVTSHEPSLEDIFLTFYGSGADGPDAIEEPA